MFLKRSILIVGAIFLGFVPSASSQDHECDIESIVAEFTDRIVQADSLDALNQINADLSLTLANCQTPTSASPILTFTEEDGNVLGPFDLEPGWYKFDAVIESNTDRAAVEFTLVHDEDRLDAIMGHYSASMSSSSTFARLHGGSYFINVDPKQESTWRLDISLVDPRDTTTQTSTVVVGRRATLGPLELETGFYTVAYEATGDGDKPSIYIYILTKEGRIANILRDEASLRDLLNGRQVINVEAGTYFININLYSALPEGSVSIIKR